MYAQHNPSSGALPFSTQHNKLTAADPTAPPLQLLQLLRAAPPARLNRPGPYPVGPHPPTPDWKCNTAVLTYRRVEEPQRDAVIHQVIVQPRRVVTGQHTRWPLLAAVPAHDTGVRARGGRQRGVGVRAGVPSGRSTGLLLLLLLLRQRLVFGAAGGIPTRFESTPFVVGQVELYEDPWSRKRVREGGPAKGARMADSSRLTRTPMDDEGSR